MENIFQVENFEESGKKIDSLKKNYLSNKLLMKKLKTIKSIFLKTFKNARISILDKVFSFKNC